MLRFYGSKIIQEQGGHLIGRLYAGIQPLNQHGSQRHDQEIYGPYSQGPTQIETANVDFAGFGFFYEQQIGDQETRYQKENIHAKTAIQKDHVDVLSSKRQALGIPNTHEVGVSIMGYHMLKQMAHKNHQGRYAPQHIKVFKIYSCTRNLGHLLSNDDTKSMMLIERTNPITGLANEKLNYIYLLHRPPKNLQ
jgi:hypothetical protein